MSASVEVIAGPYELLNPKNKIERITIAILESNEIQKRFYQK